MKLAAESVKVSAACSKVAETRELTVSSPTLFARDKLALTRLSEGGSEVMEEKTVPETFQEGFLQQRSEYLAS